MCAAYKRQGERDRDILEKNGALENGKESKNSQILTHTQIYIYIWYHLRCVTSTIDAS